MTQEEMQKKVNDLMANEVFAQKVSACETCEELAEMFNGEGLAVTAEEMETALEQISVANADGEISEGDLEDVSGGCIISGTAFLAWCIGYSIYAIGSAVVLRKYCKGKKNN